MAGRPLHCIEFSMVGVGQQHNPFDVPLGSGSIEFEAFDHAGQPHQDAQVHDNFRGATGLDTGHRLEVRLLNLKRITTVAVKLLHLAAPATVEALARGGVVDTGQTDATQGVPQLVTLNARAIDGLAITAPANETVLIEICVGGR